MRTSQLYCAHELMRHEITDRVVIADSKLEPEENRELFARSNSDQYYVSINCWLNLIWDIAGDLAMYRVKNLIYDRGFLAIIRLAKLSSERVISLISGKPLTEEVNTDEVVQFESLFHGIQVRALLQVLRFPKRFTLNKSVRLEAKSYEKFEAIQDELNWRLQTRLAYANYLQRDPEVSMPTNRWTKKVAKYFNQFFDGWDTELPKHVGHFSGGNCSDGGTMLEKIKSFAKYEYNRESVLYPLGDPSRVIETFKYEEIRVWGVPKSAEAYRIIAPETARSSYYLQQLKDALVACMKRSKWYEYVDQEDQIRQAHRAYYGAITGSYCTYDISGASDGIALYWMRQIMREDLFQYIMEWRPPRVSTGRRTQFLSTFLLSGHPCTFLLETAFFWSILMVARDEHIASPFTEDSRELEWEIGYPSSFGDDMIFDVAYEEEARTLLDAFGIHVNFEKSFSVGDYRESCGVEYLKDQPMRSAYWPRTHIFAQRSATAEDYASLVSLQHRLYDYPHACGFIEQVVRYFWPKVTESWPGIPGTLDEASDLWATLPTFRTRKRPYGAYWKEGYQKVDCPDESTYVAHSGLKTVYPKVVEVDLEDADLLQVWLYTIYLEEGPQYEDELSKLLKVSKRRTLLGMVTKPNIKVDLLT